MVVQRSSVFKRNPVNTRLNGNQPKKSRFEEIGTSGLEAFAGFIKEAYLADLRWPSVWPTYKRLYRADPEVGIARFMLTSLIRNVDLAVDLPENPTDDDKKIKDFIESDFDNVMGGIQQMRDKMITAVPLLGFGIWEMVPGRRDPSWRAPGEEEWKSQYDDGLIGLRKLAFRDYSSFHRWDMDDKTGFVRGFVQFDPPNPTIIIPRANYVHLTFGDTDNPEGLATLEALHRLERLKFGLEVVMGIGFEHTAGYLSVKTTADFSNKQLSSSDVDAIKNAAQAILTAQEGNFAAWPKGIEGEFMDTDFGAARSILEAVRYFGLLKLQLINMHWVAQATTAGTGAYASVQDSSLISLMTFNAMVEGLVDQFANQYINWILRMNPGVWPNLTRRPRINASKVYKPLNPQDTVQFIEMYASNWDLGERDLITIRKQSQGILPESLPEEEEIVEGKGKEEPTPDNSADVPFDGGQTQEGEDADAEDGKPLSRSRVRQALSDFATWAKRRRPGVFRILQERVKES